MTHQTLVSPDGEEYTARTPVEANDLIYGAGYTPAGNRKPDTAARPTTSAPPPRTPGPATS